MNYVAAFRLWTFYKMNKLPCEETSFIFRALALVAIVALVFFAVGYREGKTSITTRARFEKNVKDHGYFYPFRLELLPGKSSENLTIMDDIEKDAVITGATEVVTKRIGELMEKHGTVTTRKVK